MFLSKGAITFLFLVAMITAGTVYLAGKPIPAPQHTVQKAIANDRFFK